MTTKKAAPKESFESSLETLEGILRELETGDKGLEESLSLFEKGVVLAKALTTQLEEAKHKVEVLVKEGKTGTLTKKPFDETQE
ncbi:MAG: exodeoxyribonuclease VII small subunit [Elusimicrobia bacterium]|nr:exodeoxyribonuclease VII small subunit [Elusimicrobiota bacterium]